MGVPVLTALIHEYIKTHKAGEHTMWGTWPLVTDIGHPEQAEDYEGPRITLLS
jgi:hypothetical protein